MHRRVGKHIGTVLPEFQKGAILINKNITDM